MAAAVAAARAASAGRNPAIRRILAPLAYSSRSISHSISPVAGFSPAACQAPLVPHAACLSTAKTKGQKPKTPPPPPPLLSVGPWADYLLPEMAKLFPGCDYKHWLVIIDRPGGVGATRQQMIDCYVQTLSHVVGSEEEAKKKIYNVKVDRYFGFGCELDEETAVKLESIPGVLYVLPDSYLDVENKDYGAELYVNGEIIQRTPEREERVRMMDEVPPKTRGRPRKKEERTRYINIREHQRLKRY